MLKYVVTIEYQDGSETKLTIERWELVDQLLNARLDCDANAKLVKRVTICPIVTA